MDLEQRKKKKYKGYINYRQTGTNTGPIVLGELNISGVGIPVNEGEVTGRIGVVLVGGVEDEPENEPELGLDVTEEEAGVLEAGGVDDEEMGGKVGVGDSGMEMEMEVVVVIVEVGVIVVVVVVVVVGVVVDGTEDMVGGGEGGGELESGMGRRGEGRRGVDAVVGDEDIGVVDLKLGLENREKTTERD